MLIISIFFSFQHVLYSSEYKYHYCATYYHILLLTTCFNLDEAKRSVVCKRLTNSLRNDKTLDRTKVEIVLAKMIFFVCDRLQTLSEKEENAGHQLYHPLSTPFSKALFIRIVKSLIKGVVIGDILFTIYRSN